MILTSLSRGGLGITLQLLVKLLKTMCREETS